MIKSETHHRTNQPRYGSRVFEYLAEEQENRLNLPNPLCTVFPTVTRWISAAKTKTKTLWEQRQRQRQYNRKVKDSIRAKTKTV